MRKICDDCRTEFEPSAKMLMELNLTPDMVRGKKFYYGRGCDRCNNTGHRGRMGIYELMTMNDDLRDLISGGASTEDLVRLRDSGLASIYRGQTTIEDVVRETVEDE